MWVEGEKKKKKKSPQQHVLRYAYVRSIQLQGSLDFYYFFIIIGFFPPPTEENELLGSDTRSGLRFGHSLGEPHLQDNAAQK